MSITQKILVIEDEPMICDLIVNSFEDWTNTEVDFALSGQAGAQKLGDVHYDLVIIDAVLPGNSGLALAELAANQNMPVLLMTGYPVLLEKLDGIDFPFLRKPFAISELMMKAQAAIAESRDNILRVKKSLEIMKSRAGALAAAMNDSKKLIEEAQRLRKRSEATTTIPSGFASLPAAAAKPDTD